jgi:hypothetical protein
MCDDLWRRSRELSIAACIHVYMNTDVKMFRYEIFPYQRKYTKIT